MNETLAGPALTAPAARFATDAVAAAPSWVGAVTLCTVPKLIGQTLAAAKRLVALAGCALGDVTGPKANRNSLHVVKREPSDTRTWPSGRRSTSRSARASAAKFSAHCNGNERIAIGYTHGSTRTGRTRSP
jgi:hypothetical protein